MLLYPTFEHPGRLLRAVVMIWQIPPGVCRQANAMRGTPMLRSIANQNGVLEHRHSTSQCLAGQTPPLILILSSDLQRAQNSDCGTSILSPG